MLTRPLAASSSPQDRLVALRASVEQTQQRVDQWEADVHRDLELSEQCLRTAAINDRRGALALKASGVSLGLVAFGGLLQLAGTPLAMVPGIVCFTVATVISMSCTGRRDKAYLDRSFLYQPALHKQELLQSKLKPRLAREKAELAAEEERVAELQGAQVIRIAEGMKKPAPIEERAGGLVVGGTILRHKVQSGPPEAWTDSQNS